MLIHTYTSRLENHPGVVRSSISDQQCPTYDDKRHLEARKHELSDGLSPCGEIAAAAEIIAKMFMSYVAVRLDRDQAANTAVAYLAQVKHLPLWAIEIGCQSCIARDNPFPPSAGELRTACEKAVQPLRDEEAAIRKILEAEVYHSAPQTERDRVRAGFQKLLNDLKSNEVSHRRNGKDRRHDYPLGRRYRPPDRRDAKEPVPDGKPLPTLSDAALAKFFDQEPPFSISDEL